MTDYNKKFDIQLKQGQKLEEQLEAFFTGQSGIAVTTSDYWALCLVRDEQLMQMYILPTDTLRRITRRYWDTDRNVIGGDLKKSKGILVPIDDIAHGYKF